MTAIKNIDVIIIGAGAAGLMCAIEAGKRGRRVLVIEKANKPGKKILMSGGGRCNFTNYDIRPSAYLSNNPHFCKSALKRFSQWDFISLVEKHQIGFQEKKLGQLFCTHKAKDILNMLLEECEKAQVKIQFNQSIESITPKQNSGFDVQIGAVKYDAQSVVVACGGLSIPTLGSSPFGYKIAEQFGHKVWPLTAGLVPFTLHKPDLSLFEGLSGVSQPCRVNVEDTSFEEDMLFTHRGLSGPAMLQISSYWSANKALSIDLLPKLDLKEDLKLARQTHPKQQAGNYLTKWLSSNLVKIFLNPNLINKRLADCSNADLELVTTTFKSWQIKPNATEGYRTAEVTKGGVDCDSLSSKTMESSLQKGLYFVGEVVDVTGWLGGYNFQWAWSSGWAAGQVA